METLLNLDDNDYKTLLSLEDHYFLSFLLKRSVHISETVSYIEKFEVSIRSSVAAPIPTMVI